ncbi:MAG: hypothetical protein GX126_16815 [Bacteroidales bacterium]|nr:hypothetical protein [Bacteroidales bacterium]
MRQFIFLILALILFRENSEAQLKVTAAVAGDKIDFMVNGVLFTSYIMSEYEKYPFFSPVNGPSGASVTSLRNGNYPHHSSLFFGCDRVNGGNYWQEGADRGRIVSLRADIVESGGDRAVVSNECIWTRPGAESPVRDKRRITVFAPSPDKYIIDFDIILEMLDEVTIEKTNHSLFSCRVDPDLSVKGGGTMINSEGMKGEKLTFGKRSAWIDYYGERFGKTEGVAILQHPSCKWYPAPWFTRDYGFISPTPMYWPENDRDLTLDKGELVKLRYRVIVHSGDHLTAGIEEEFVKYKSE